MMTRDELQTVLMGMLVGGILVFLILAKGFGAKPEYHWHRQIIQHGAGQYNKTTGAFEWVTGDSGRAP